MVYLLQESYNYTILRVINLKKAAILLASTLLFSSVATTVPSISNENVAQAKVKQPSKYTYQGKYSGSFKVKTLAITTSTAIIFAIPALAFEAKLVAEIAKDLISNEMPDKKVYFTVKQYHGYTSEKTGNVKRTYIHSKQVYTFYKDSKKKKKLFSKTEKHYKLHSTENF